MRWTSDVVDPALADGLGTSKAASSGAVVTSITG
jgi:hypothetical protein